MKGLKLAAILGVMFFTLNTNALKLKIVKKSASVGHGIVDQADFDSGETEASLRDQIENFDNDDNNFDEIKASNKKIIKRQTATYKAVATPVKTVKKEVESLIEENDISEDLPTEISKQSEEKAVQEMKKSIKDEFEDEISMEEEIADKNSHESASTGY